MPPHDDFVARLRQLMAARGIDTQKELAASVGVAAPTVWAWFHQGIPQARTIETICRKLGVDREWLEHGIGEIDPSVVREEPGSPQVERAPYAALAPLIYRLYEEFSRVIADLPQRTQSTALRRFREILLDPLARPEKMLSYQLGIDEKEAKRIIEKIKRGEKP